MNLGIFFFRRKSDKQKKRKNVVKKMSNTFLSHVIIIKPIAKQKSNNIYPIIMVFKLNRSLFFVSLLKEMNFSSYKMIIRLNGNKLIKE